MQSKRFNLHIYLQLIKMTLNSMAQYRADFWMSIVGVFLLNGANLLQIGVISWRFQAIGDWGIGDLMVLYGLCMVSWSIFSIFFRNVTSLENEIVSGTFDKYLLRPVSPFVQLVGGEFRYTGLCDTLLGVPLIIYGVSAAGVHWTAFHYLWLIVFIISGGAIAVSIQLLIACVSFWTTRSNALRSMFTQIYLLTQKYPITIFGRAFRVLVTLILPVAFWNFYPAVLLMGKSDAPIWLCMMSPIVALALVFISSVVWKKGVARYEGSGS